jgi:thiamine-phosphate pyrophosphorylase
LQPARKPILCYVTDRRALANRHDSSADQLAPLQQKIRDAIAAGVDWIQIREKDLPARPLLELAQFAVHAARGSRTRILVNDRLDVAVASGAGGLHLGESSFAAQAVVSWRGQSASRDFQIGVSCHSSAAVQQAEASGADYVFFGPVFATPSKAAYGAPQGIARLRQVCGAARIPVIAIGGINPESASQCIDAGAAGVAAIRFFQDHADMGALVKQLHA